MKVAILLCLAALALAYDHEDRPHGHGYKHGGRPHHPEPHSRDGRVYYSYNIDYPKSGARQGKWESINPYGTFGSYYVNEPKSDIYVSYDFPNDDHKW